MIRNRKSRVSLADNRQVAFAFTLIELLASMAILGLIMVMLFSAFEQISKAWVQGESRVETFTDARAILDLMSRELSQAIATAKIPFYVSDKNHIYFIAPINTDVGNAVDLCEVGYEFDNVVPTVPAALIRRLTESTDAHWDFYTKPATWWQSFDLTKDAALANGNILNLTFACSDINGNPIPLPYNSATSGNKLPYAIVISMDVVDSRTLTRLKVMNDPTGQASPQITKPAVRNFTTTVYLPNALP